MHRRTIAVPLAFAALVAGVPRGADAADNVDTASGSYQCMLGNGAPETTTVTLGLEHLPSEVAPGQRLSLAGTLTVSFPVQEALKSTLMAFKGITITTGDLTVATTPGSGATVSDVSGTAVDPKYNAPLTLTAGIKTKAFQVPSNASDITFALPSENTVANPYAGASAPKGTPDKVAFTLDLTQKGILTSRRAACWLGDDRQIAPLADVLVSSKQQPPPGGDSGPQPGTQSGTHTGSQAGTQTGTPTGTQAGTQTGAIAADPGATGGSALSTDPNNTAVDPGATGGSATTVDPNAAAVDPGAPATSAPVTGGSTQAINGTEMAYASVPAATKPPGTFLPWWLILLGGSVIPLTAAGYAVLMRRRLSLATGASAARSGRAALKLGGAR